MRIFTIYSCIIAFMNVIAGISPLSAMEVLITVTNTTSGTYFTPLLLTAHSESEHLFELGTPASSELQAMAEGGDISGLVSQLGGADADTITNPAQGLLAPGSSVTTPLSVNDSSHTQLSLVAMLLPTNDGFVGLDGLTIPTIPGTYVFNLNAYDAGTEANDERVVGDAGGVPGTPGIPADPSGLAGAHGTGVTDREDNLSVHIHRGIIGDTDTYGGISDLNSTRHRWLNPVAKLVLEVL